MRCKKAQIQKLQEHIQQLAEQQRRLECANASMCVHAAMLEELVKLRNALVRALECVCPDGAQAAASSHTQQAALSADEQQLLDVLPPQRAAALFGGINEALYKSIMALTPGEAADYWLARVREVALAVRLHERDPVNAAPLLEAAVNASMRWAIALHIFNPRVVYALHDYNLITRRYEPPPPHHWVAVAQAGAFTPEQVRAIQVMLSIVRPRLERLEERKQQLLAEIRSLEQGGSSTVVGTGAQQVGAVPHRSRCDHGAAAAAAASQPAGSQRGSSTSNGDDSAPSSSSSSRRQERADDDIEGMVSHLQRRQELVQQLASNYAAWRTTSQMRAHWITAACTHTQLALGILEAFPYMIHGAPVCSQLDQEVPRWP